MVSRLKKHAPENAERAAYNNAQADLPTHGGAGMQGGAQPGMAADPNAGTGGGRHHHGHRADPIPPTNAGNGMRTDALADRQYGGAGAGGAGGAAIPPTATLHDPHQARGGAAMTGKIEHAVGSMVGSNALKAKGLQKEQEAQSLKVQSSELAEAERLEREAALRRERAVAHGAHPDNRHIGGTGNGTYT